MEQQALAELCPEPLVPQQPSEDDAANKPVTAHQQWQEKLQGVIAAVREVLDEGEEGGGGVMTLGNGCDVSAYDATTPPLALAPVVLIPLPSDSDGENYSEDQLGDDCTLNEAVSSIAVSLEGNKLHRAAVLLLGALDAFHGATVLR